jgi:hypothetical protein
MGNSVVSSSSLALSTRRCSSHWSGLIPVSAWKRLVRVRTLVLA